MLPEILDEHAAEKDGHEVEALVLPQDVLRVGDGNYCCKLVATLEGLHEANIVAVALMNEGNLLTGSVDRTIRAFKLDRLADGTGKEGER